MTNANETLTPEDPIRQLCVEAGNRTRKNRRTDVRFPFFRPVSIQLDEGQRYSAFSRDISAAAIGLMHNMEVPVGEVDLSISSQSGYSVHVRARVTRCEPCGEGWSISACEFLGVPTVTTP